VVVVSLFIVLATVVIGCADHSGWCGCCTGDREVSV